MYKLNMPRSRSIYAPSADEVKEAKTRYLGGVAPGAIGVAPPHDAYGVRGGESPSILNPSKQPSSFSQKYELKRETLTSQDGEREVNVVPVTKVEVVPSDSSSNPKHVYVNVSAQNVSTFEGIPASLQLDFDQPILKNCEKYYLTIVKGVFPTNSIPYFEFISGLYKISITYPADSFQVSIPLIPLSIKRGSDFLFFVYHYEDFLDSINQAMLTAFCQLKSAPGSTFAGNLPPFIVYDKAENRFSLVAEQGFWYPDTLTGAILSMDFTTYRLVNGLPASYYIGQPTDEIGLLIDNNGSQVSTSYATNISMNGNMSKNIDTNWDQFHIFSRGNIVLFQGIYYACIANNTVGPQPNLFPASWQAQTAVNPNIWAVGTTYVQSQIVYYPTANSVPFISLQFPNVGNVPNPAAPTAFWFPLTSGNPTTYSQAGVYSVKQNVYYPNISSGNIYTNISGANPVPPDSVTPFPNVNWAPATVFNTYQIKSDFSSLAQWSFVEAMVVESTSLPIRYEIYPAPSSDVQGVNSSSQVPKPVVTDFDINREITGFDRTPVLYVPPGNYRMIDMLARDELRRIDINIEYKLKDLTFKQLIMYPGDYLALKLLFIRNDAVSLV